MSDVALVDVHLSRLRKVEVFGPGVIFVDNDLYFIPDTVTPKPVLSAVIYDLTGDDPQDESSFEDFLNGYTNFANPFFPLRDFSSPCKCTSLASQSALEVIHNPLSYAVKVAISQRSQIGGIWIFDGVEALGHRNDGIGVLKEHTVDSSKHSRFCVPQNLDDPLALLLLIPDRTKLVFKDTIIIFLTEKLDFQNELVLWYNL